MLSLLARRRRVVVLAIIAVLIAVAALVPGWCAVTGLWW